MSICIRNGVRYNRHKFEKAGLTDTMVCKHCDSIKGGGGVFESGDQEGTSSGDSSELSTDGSPRAHMSDVLATA